MSCKVSGTTGVWCTTPMHAYSPSMIEPFDPASLVQRVRQGSGDALSDLYARYGHALMAVAYRLTGSRADSEDILHDVFLGLPEALRHYDERGTLESWLKRVTARVALTRLRGRLREREVSFMEDSIPPAASPSAERLADLITVQRAIDALPDTLRVVFVLREIEGYSHTEIGDLLQITPNASEVRLHRALRALRRTIGKDS
jgi:RNA polymerase sigma-70 factor (ECF subfamily)